MVVFFVFILFPCLRFYCSESNFNTYLQNIVFKEPEILKKPVPKEKTPVPAPEKVELPPAKGAC